jgi:hypothetical protein
MVKIIGEKPIVYADDSGTVSEIHYHVMRVLVYLAAERVVYVQTLAVHVLPDGSGQTLDESKQRAFTSAGLNERQVTVHASDTAATILGVNSANPELSKGESERGRQRLQNSLMFNSECLSHGLDNIAKAGALEMTGVDPDWSDWQAADALTSKLHVQAGPGRHQSSDNYRR